MKNDVYVLHSSHLQEAFSEPDCAVFHLATCFMCLEWKCTKSQFPPGEAMSHHAVGCFRAGWTWFQSLGLFHWGLNCPLMGMAETPTAKRAAAPRSPEHKVTACKSCTSMPWCGSVGSFLLPGNAAIEERSPAAPLAWCALARALKAAGESLTAFTLAEPCSSLPLPQLCSLGPSRLSMEGLKVLQKPSQGNKLKLCWKGRVTGVFLDRKFHKGYQDHAEGISCPGFRALGPMASFLLLCLKTHTAYDLAVAFILGICVICIYAQVGCGALAFHVEQLLTSTRINFCVIAINISSVWFLLSL